MTDVDTSGVIDVALLVSYLVGILTGISSKTDDISVFYISLSIFAAIFIGVLA